MGYTDGKILAARMNQNPRYSMLEIERRWLVDPKNLDILELNSFRLVEDWYLIGTRIRLRSIKSQDGETIYKLGKKYGKQSVLAEPITTLYLTMEEFQVFSNLPANYIKKRRYAICEGSLDHFLEPEKDFLIYELEFSNEEEARKYIPPSFVGEEITGHANYYGFSLANRPN